MFAPVCSPNIREFLFWKEAAHRGSQSKLHAAHKTMDLGFPRAFLPLAVFSACLSDHRFAGKLLQTMVFFCPFPDNSAL